MYFLAEHLAKTWQVTREQQDEYAALSQARTKSAIEKGLFDNEIVPVIVKTRNGVKVISADEFPKPDTTMIGLAKLKPAFARDGSGTVTAGNASGLNDGAAFCVVMSGDEAKKRHIRPLGTITSFATVGLDPMMMGFGPVPAIRKAVSKMNFMQILIQILEAV
jgi:acetyl-CoA C-acetyltransferase